MSVKVDTERSTKARTEGNASFKKGKWTEAIGHYTTAIVYNPQDGLGYTNRAAAYLKLDRWKDAERDCSSAISLPKGDTNVKALYRRSLARKALSDLAGALEDVQAVLAIEPTNETAKEEELELRYLHRKHTQVGDGKAKKTNDLPPSPPRSPAVESASGRPSATIEEINDTTEPAIPVREIDTSLKQTETARSSFADLKKGRQAKKTFATPNFPSSSVPVVDTSPSSPSTLSLEKASISNDPPAPASSTTAARSHLSSEPLALLDPTIPGSALSFVSAIRTHTAEATWPVIAELAKQPAAVGKMLDNFLEPDQLALIVARLRETIALSHTTEEERSTAIMGLLAGLRLTKRWSMTAMMLSSEEKQSGQEVWTSAGGTGDWTKRS